MLAVVDFNNPLLWAVFIGWVLSVVLHEFAHGIVAYLGGDYTIRERGGLTLNPLQYIDPVMSLLLPIVVFLIGGIPLPGGVTYIRRDLLRSRKWELLVSAAGPAMNFLLFLALVLPFHPSLRWVAPPAPGNASNAMLFVGAMAWLQMLAMLFNLLPVPPLDGFGIISPYMNPVTRRKLMTPPLSNVFFLGLFFLAGPLGLIRLFHRIIEAVLLGLGFDRYAVDFFGTSYSQALFGHP
jgi:Zn-dependent protease